MWRFSGQFLRKCTKIVPIVTHATLVTYFSGWFILTCISLNSANSGLHKFGYKDILQLSEKIVYLSLPFSFRGGSSSTQLFIFTISWFCKSIGGQVFRKIRGTKAYFVRGINLSRKLAIFVRVNKWVLCKRLFC